MGETLFLMFVIIAIYGLHFFEHYFQKISINMYMIELNTFIKF